MIEKNIGTHERVVRLLLSIALASWMWLANIEGPLAALLGVLALFLFLNAFFSRCYMWSWLGLSTCGRAEC